LANFLTEKSGESNVTKNCFLGNNVPHYEEHNAKLAIFRQQVPNYTKKLLWGGGEGVREMGHIRFSQIWFKNASILLIFWLTAGTCCRNLAFFFFFFFPFGNLAN
jgi:hypothetical protein